MNTQTADHQTEVSTDRQRWLALYVLCAGFLMIVLDMTVVNVALPSIQKDLGFTTSTLAWVVNAYLIAFAGLLLLGGRLGDLVGRRNVFLSGLTLFTAASLACGFSQSQEALVIARFIQGIGGALTSAVILGMIVTLFPSPKDMAKAFGVYAFVASSGGAVGLLVGGILTQAINWHWIFFVNVPIAICTAVAATRLIERDRGIGYREGADIPGSILITSALMLSVYTIVKPAAEKGWTATETLTLGAVSIALLVAFFVRQATAKKPLMALGILKSRNLAGANLIQIVSVSGMFGVFFLGSLYMQQILNYDALTIGFAFLPVTLIMGGMSVKYSDKLVMRFGARPVLLPGLGLIGAATVWLTFTTADGNYFVQLLPAMILLGTGAGLAFPALMNLAMSGVPESQAGLASGIANTTAQVGAALGLALLATLSASRTATLLDDGSSRDAAMLGGFHLSFWVGAGLLAAGIAIALTVLQAPKAAVAHETNPAEVPDTELVGAN